MGNTKVSVVVFQDKVLSNKKVPDIALYGADSSLSYDRRVICE
jgi:hypothetical protein